MKLSQFYWKFQKGFQKLVARVFHQMINPPLDTDTVYIIKHSLLLKKVVELLNLDGTEPRFNRGWTKEVLQTNKLKLALT